MTERTKSIVEKLTSRRSDQLLAAVEDAGKMRDLSDDETRDLVHALSSLFFLDHANNVPLRQAKYRAEEVMGSFGAHAAQFIFENLLEADVDSMRHFGRALASIGSPAVEPVLKAADEHKDDQFTLACLLYTMGFFKGDEALKFLPLVLEYAGSKNTQVKSSALSAIGRISNRVECTSVSEPDRKKMFDACFNALSDAKPLTRLHSVKSIGKMLKNSYLNEKQVDKAHGSFRAILGFDNFEWDDAYVVRNEAKHFLHLCRSESQAGDRVKDGRYHQDFKILSKRELCADTYHFRLNAPLIARKIQAGQFIMIRPNAHSERIPLSICGWNRDEGYLEIIIMATGRTSTEAVEKNVGDRFRDVVGPLGQRSHVAKYDGACVLLGGGYGTGAVIPTARDLKEQGNTVYGIVGARTKDLLIMVDELKEVCDKVFVTTNDGSEGIEGFVTHALEKIMAEEKVAMTLSVGPVPMMIAITKLIDGKDIEGWVSLNAIMVDGTGMCGSCRVSVGGETKFACFHGPDFKGGDVDFDQLMKRQRMFVDKEKIAMEALEA